MGALAKILEAVTEGELSFDEAALILGFIATNPELDWLFALLGIIAAIGPASKLFTFLGKAIFNALESEFYSLLNNIKDPNIRNAILKYFYFMLK